MGHTTAHTTQRAAVSAPLEATQQALRRQLQTLTELQPSHLHSLSVPRLADTQVHAHVRVLSDPTGVPQPLYNCVMYALGLVDRFEPQLERIQGLDFRFVADTGFLQHLLADGVLRDRVAPAQAVAGDLLVYSGADGLPRHVARYLGHFQGKTLCASKWGPGGLYEHGLWDLPLNLGEQADFYRAPVPERVLALLARRVPGLRMKPQGQPPPRGEGALPPWPSHPGAPTLRFLPAAQARPS